MSRRILISSALALGLTVSALTTTNTWSAFEDSIDSGKTSLATGERKRPLVLWISEAQDCNTTVTSAPPRSMPTLTWSAGVAGGTTVSTSFCLRNKGGATNYKTTMKLKSITDVDTKCTGGEADVDATCGSNQAGEAAPVIALEVKTFNCTTGSSSSVVRSFKAWTAVGETVNLNTNQTKYDLCVTVSAKGITPNPSVSFASNEADLQRAQSDTVTWEWTFTAEPVVG